MGILPENVELVATIPLQHSDHNSLGSFSGDVGAVV